MPASYSHRQKRHLLAALLMTFCYAIVVNSTSYFVAPVTAALGVSHTEFSLFNSILQLLCALALPLAGGVLPRFGVRRMALLGSVWIASGLTVFSLSTQIWMFYLAGAWTGFGLAFCTMLAATVVINSAFPVNSGVPMGIAMAGTGVCGVLLGFIMPPLIDGPGWRTAYRVLAAMWFAALALAVLLLGRGDSAAVQKKPAASRPDAAPANAAGYTRAQALRSPALYFLLLYIMLGNVCGCFLMHMSAFFTGNGLSGATAGTLLSVLSAALIVFKIAMGGGFDRFGPVAVVVAANAGFALGFLLMRSSALPLLYLGVIFLSAGMASQVVLIPLLTRAMFGERDFAGISSIATMGLNTGVAAGITLWGVSYDLSGSYRLAITAAPVIIVCVTVIMVVVLKKMCPAKAGRS